MVPWKLPAELASWVHRLEAMLHQRLAGRLTTVLLGMLFARGRRTVASWLRAAHVGLAFPAYYYFLGSLGRNVDLVASALLGLLVQLLAPGDCLLFALDDTPTKRYGPKVQGAGIHHNPTPGPADQKFLYGHVWVTLALLVRHPLWHTIGLPLRAWMYIRRKDIAKLPRRTKVKFRTKLEMAADLIAWTAQRLRWLGKRLWVVLDGAYGKRPVLKEAKAQGVVVVSRLRKDARLYAVPKPPRQRRPGRPRKYGAAISLARRGAHPRAWQTGEFLLYGKTQSKTYKTFVATYPPAGGTIRVVLVKETEGWVAFFATDPAASVAQVLEAVADRAAIEQDFHDLKEVHGAGQQQVRNYWVNVAVYHLSLWLHTLVELWAWSRPKAQLCDRSESPWDDPQRRPSHADRRKALRRTCLEQEFREAQAHRPFSRKLRRMVSSLLRMAR
jgi:DDE superfamily endonuclease